MVFFPHKLDRLYRSVQYKKSAHFCGLRVSSKGHGSYYIYRTSWLRESCNNVTEFLPVVKFLHANASAILEWGLIVRTETNLAIRICTNFDRWCSNRERCISFWLATNTAAYVWMLLVYYSVYTQYFACGIVLCNSCMLFFCFFDCTKRTSIFLFIAVIRCIIYRWAPTYNRNVIN